MVMQKKIIFLMPYFGKFPEWFPLYLESCRWNPTIDWLFFTDCPVPKNAPTNVRFVSMSFPEYQQLASQQLGVTFKTESSYAVCNLRPAYGIIHQEYIERYDYFGFGDVDVIYGNLRAFYTDEVLTYNTLSTHPNSVSGHLCLIKNNEQWLNAFRKIPNWQQRMTQPLIAGVDEAAFTKILRGYRRLPTPLCQLWGIFDTYKRNHLFKERFSTIFSQYPWIDGSYNYPKKWFWHQGQLTVESGEEMMYLHFMNWKSSRYLLARYGKRAAWESLPQLIDPNLRDLSEGFCISDLGFTPLDKHKQFQ
jgi:hypothetical protein